MIHLSKQEQDIYNLLDVRGNTGVKCFEFVPLLHITQPNPRVLSLRKKFGCKCINSRGHVLFNCPGSQHFVNDGEATYLVKSKAEQLSFYGNP
jgi:hypothetical protein